MPDKYVKVTCEMVWPTDNAISVQTPHSDVVRWIPKSLIHGGDLLKLDRAVGKEVVTFRLMEWKAKELGL